MRHALIENTFESWRDAARELIAEEVVPDEVIWDRSEQAGLFLEPPVPHAPRRSITTVPVEFIRLAENVACFDRAEKWSLLYRLLYRLVHEGRHVLAIESDVEVRQARLMEKAVKRDIHKFHAFVRFRQIECEGREIFAAWHEPQHFTVVQSAPFFARRFGSMAFSILTPKGSAHWDKKSLAFGPPMKRSSAPEPDNFESYWLLYYRSIFNPFRLKVGAMKKEFPVRHWPTLPEAVLIPELIRDSNQLASF